MAAALPPLKILLANPRGFCAGVVRAIDIVERALTLGKNPVYVRHEIVHNKHVVETLKGRGAVFVDETDQIPEGALAIFSAHGVSKEVEREATARKLDAADIPHKDNASHIVPVMVGDPVRCKQISDVLLEEFGIYVQPINYPTVPRGTERLRFTPGPLHTDADIDYLVDTLSAIWSELGLQRAA